MDTEVLNFKIADLNLMVTNHGRIGFLELLPSFIPFVTSETEVVMSFAIESELPTESKGEFIKSFKTGNGAIDVYLNDSGDSVFEISDLAGNKCCTLISNADFSICHCRLYGNIEFQRFGLNNALMLSYSFAASNFKTLLIHGACVRHKNKAYVFTAESGVGKSTHANLWVENIPDTDLINDDNPAIRAFTGRNVVYGTPWSGKTPCYRNIKCDLGAFVSLNRGSTNKVEPLNTIESYTALQSACSSIRWNKKINKNLLDTICEFIGSSKRYKLFCKPDKESAILCRNTISI